MRGLRHLCRATITKGDSGLNKLTIEDGPVLAAEFEHMRYKFYHDRVILLLDPAEKAKLGTGLLVAPDSMEERPFAGTVVGVGVGELVQKWGIKLCDRVLIQRWNPTELKVRRMTGEDVTLVAFHVYDLYMGWEDEDILAILEATRCSLASST